ncbi:MAG: hypothetical protein J6Q99_01155, partial [Oscillospiraceae bacterium]|nr:hypothetical protein [Oscillospiraceae bacterium]
GGFCRRKKRGFDGQKQPSFRRCRGEILLLPKASPFAAAPQGRIARPKAFPHRGRLLRVASFLKKAMLPGKLSWVLLQQKFLV